jgi:hypothetical protein
MTNGRIFIESVLDLLEMTLVFGILVFVVSIGRDVWLAWRGDEK